MATLMINYITKPWPCNALSAIKTSIEIISHKKALFYLILITIYHNSKSFYVFGALNEPSCNTFFVRGKI